VIASKLPGENLKWSLLTSKKVTYVQTSLLAIIEVTENGEPGSSKILMTEFSWKKLKQKKRGWNKKKMYNCFHTFKVRKRFVGNISRD